MMNTQKAMRSIAFLFLKSFATLWLMPATKTYIWQQAPFVRLLMPLIMGIIVQWYLPLPNLWLLTTAILGLLFILLYFFLPLKYRYRASVVNGIAILILIACLGAMLVNENNVRKKAQWFGNTGEKQNIFTVRLLEPLVEKQNSLKALAEVAYAFKEDSIHPVKGKMILYFKKDSFVRRLGYGSQIVLNKPLQEITNSGNPGAFDYKRYCLFQGITHQVYLLPSDFISLKNQKTELIPKTIFQVRTIVVATLQRFINGSKEQGLAEALLIGYKDDLDKNLVEAYSNTGVVHIIAISGLHLGLIYALLLMLTKRLKKKKALIWIRFLLIVFSLWAFSLVAGAQASVLRSAVMFTCIAYGEVIARRTSVYNTLALSAFVLLCYNPFWLWDVGFQLSYAAVLSIVIFFRPIYNLIYIKNKALDSIWKLNAVTLAAQILALPISIYHFHQFPVLFLLANLVAVPLSSGILIGEIILLIVSFVPPVAAATGWLLQNLMWFMNTYVEHLDKLPFAVWRDFSISIMQTCLLYGLIAGIGLWLLVQQKKAVWLSLACLCCFVILRSYSFYNVYTQKALIVYNVPRHQAIDLVDGRNYLFVGDKELTEDSFLRNFHLQPSRIIHRMTPVKKEIIGIKNFAFNSRNILVIDSTVRYDFPSQKQLADVLILSKNPRIYIKELHKTFTIKQVVMDGSVPEWKKKLWKKDCDSLRLPYHDVTEKGAFVMKLQ